LNDSIIEEVEIMDAGENAQPRNIQDRTCNVLHGSEWIEGSQINFWLFDLKQKYPSIQGLESPSNYRYNYNPKFTGFFVQVVHVNGNHWICISNYGCKQEEINIYDSLTTFTQKTITNIDQVFKQTLQNIFPNSKRIILYIKNVQKQKNAFDCGLFSIAFSQLICNNKDPTQYKINHTTLRSHFNKCVENKVLTTFPQVYKLNKKVDNSILNLAF
jgi:hypothetical protein